MVELLADHPLLRRVGGKGALVPRRPADAVVELPVLQAPPLAPAVGAEVFDLDRYNSLVEDINRDGARQAMDLFLVETVGRLALMRGLSCERDRPQIEREAHTLRGGSQTFGFVQVAGLAETLEGAAAAIAPDAYAGLIDRIDVEFKLARDAATIELEAKAG